MQSKLPKHVTCNAMLRMIKLPTSCVETETETDVSVIPAVFTDTDLARRKP